MIFVRIFGVFVVPSPEANTGAASYGKIDGSRRRWPSWSHHQRASPCHMHARTRNLRLPDLTRGPVSAVSPRVPRARCVRQSWTNPAAKTLDFPASRPNIVPSISDFLARGRCPPRKVNSAGDSRATIPHQKHLRFTALPLKHCHPLGRYFHHKKVFFTPGRATLRNFRPPSEVYAPRRDPDRRFSLRTRPHPLAQIPFP